MAKTRRASSARTSARKSASKRPAAARSRATGRAHSRKKTSAAARPSKKQTKRTAAPRRVAPAVAIAAKPAERVATAPAPTPPSPAPPPKKPTYHEAVSLYERGLQALQRRDFATAAEALRNVIARYPDERELLERARLYLKVCERELEPREQAPKTADEWVYAATLALNSADEAAALHHLTRALEVNPRHDHAHYMMALASARRGDAERSLEHLRQAVMLNPENRALARQDPDLTPLRDTAGYRSAMEALPAPRAAQAADRSVAIKSRKARR